MREDEMPNDEIYYCDIDGTIYQEGEADFKVIQY